MRIIKKSKEINSVFNSVKKTGFVPTMGSLHKGHEYLIKKSIKQNHVTFVSIFLNPKQFNSKKDLEKYPKKLIDDIKICKKNKVDFLFIPSFKEVYSWKTKKRRFPKIENVMEEKYRKGHFKGVLKVIEKLVDIIPASRMYLGEKDFQQLKIIKDYFNINKIKTKIIRCKTIRDNNGLALSSRNKLLNNKNLKKAAKVIRFIKKIKLKNNSLSHNKKAIKKFLKINKINFDYVEYINLKKFNVSKKQSYNMKIFIAFYINKIRLIDNI
ncbi:MAG: pantoate--beta-alanine ligase [Pelagibacteraceae bacterium]